MSHRQAKLRAACNIMASKSMLAPAYLENLNAALHLETRKFDSCLGLSTKSSAVVGKRFRLEQRPDSISKAALNK